MAQETIRGFDIPKRDLTVEESTRDVTYERIRDFHHTVGEEFFDQVSIVHPKVLGGFLIHKYPEHSHCLLKIVNSDHLDIGDFRDFYEEEGGDEGEDIQFYKDACELINLTIISKQIANQVLIQVNERYNQ